MQEEVEQVEASMQKQTGQTVQSAIKKCVLQELGTYDDKNDVHKLLKNFETLKAITVLNMVMQEYVKE